MLQEITSPITGHAPVEVWPVTMDSGRVVWLAHLRWNSGVMMTHSESVWCSMSDAITDTTPAHIADGICDVIEAIRQEKAAQS